MGNAMIPLDFSHKHLGEFFIKGREIVARYCPYCHGGARHDRNTFAVNMDTGAYNCKRGSCGAQGSFNTLLRDFGEEVVNEYREQPKKIFKPSKAVIKTPEDAAIAYMGLRKIGRETMLKYGVGSDGAGNLMFPYVRDGKQVAVKYRPARRLKDGERKMWREEGTDTATLFGQHLVSGDKLVLCEGEVDCMALAECGIGNVVSVPNGSNDLNWIQANWDWLERFKEIMICGDNDEPGLQMVKECVARLGEWRCKIMYVIPDCKDANEMLFKYGKDVVCAYHSGAEFAPKEGILNLSDVQAFDIVSTKCVKTGLDKFDSVTKGLFMGQVSVWTGTTGSGKSTLLGQILLESLEQKHVVCAFSGELPAPLFKYWINLQAAGPSNLIVKPSGSQDVSDAVKDKLNTWYRNRFFITDNITNMEIDSVFGAFEYAARRFDAKVFLLDNLAMLMSGDADYYQKQGEVIKRCQKFAKKFNVHVHIVAHPRKSGDKKSGMSKEDVSGSMDIVNLADNAYGIERKTVFDANHKPIDEDIYLYVLKSRYSGRQEIRIRLRFDTASKRFYEEDGTPGPNKRYGWESFQMGWTEHDGATPF